MSDVDGQKDDGFKFVDKRRVDADLGVETVDTSESDTAEAVSEDDSHTDDRQDKVEQADDAQEQPGSEPTEDGSGTSSPTVYDMAVYVIGLFSTEAWQRLGLIADPSSKQLKTDLGQARVAIDCVSALAGVIDAQDSQVPASLRSEVKRTLNDLRLNYVSRARGS